MSKILGGGKLELSRGFAELNSKVTDEYFMSISTERESLMKRKQKTLVVLKNKHNYSRAQINAAKSEAEQCDERFKSINRKIEQLANLQALIVSRVKQSIKPEDWHCLVTLAKQDQATILENISGW